MCGKIVCLYTCIVKLACTVPTGTLVTYFNKYFKRIAIISRYVPSSWTMFR